LIVAGLSLLLALLMDVRSFLAGPQQMPVPPGADPAALRAYEVGTKIGLVVATIWPVIVLAGAIQMLKLQTYWLAMTASVVALLPCNLGCVLGLPFGIWAIVALNKEEVKDAFK
jgi:hypothetical protein